MPVPDVAAALRVVSAAGFLAIIAGAVMGACGPHSPEASSADPFALARAAMVEKQLRGRDIREPRILAAMGKIPRHLFIPGALWTEAYDDHPVPIGQGQTISQPYIVALMTQLVWQGKCRRVLDVGTGSGYQAAVLAELAPEVYSIEILCPLANEARARLARLGYTNIQVRCGDGYQGWVEHAPFDAIIVAAAAPKIPQPLVDQLAPEGRLVIPVGTADQDLLLVEKGKDGRVTTRNWGAVRFVPMTGEVQR